MDRTEILAALASRAEARVSLDDGDFYVEHNQNYPVDAGNGFLLRRCSQTVTTPGGYECVGGYEHLLNGLWRSHISADCTEESDCRSLGEFASRSEAIAQLWLNRHLAVCRVA